MNTTTKCSTTKAYARLLQTKATWEMDAEELARVFAGHYGWGARVGGWIYDEKDRPVVQGWTGLARVLVNLGWISVEAGCSAVCWRQIPSRPYII